MFTMMMETTIDNHGITLEAAATNNVTETKSQPKDRIQKSNTLNTNEKMVSSSKKIHTSPRRRLKKIGRVLRNSNNFRFKELHQPVAWQVPVLFISGLAIVFFLLDYYKIDASELR